jgi:predicted phosphoribosyltransferase
MTLRRRLLFSGTDPVFADRRDAGRRLAHVLPPLEQPLILGLPRGGVPVAAEVAAELSARFDVFVVRKLGLPWQPELAMGAIATGGVRVLNDDVIRRGRVPRSVVDEVTERESRELQARERRYRGDLPPVQLQGREVVLVDDGLATGATMRAAVAAVRLQRPARTVVGVPVAPAETVERLARDGVEVACVLVPEEFLAVGLWYADFTATTDCEVVALMRGNHS